ncbi:hypothetical protein [Microcoleus sp. B3-C5]
MAFLNSAIPCDPQEVAEPQRCLVGKLNIPGAYQLLTGKTLSSIQPSAAEGIGKKEVSLQFIVPISFAFLVCEHPDRFHHATQGDDRISKQCYSLLGDDRTPVQSGHNIVVSLQIPSKPSLAKLA